MAKRYSDWSREELLKSLCLYASLPDASHGTPSKVEISALAKALGRSEASITLRMANFIARDKRLLDVGLKGMFGGGVSVDALWQECSEENGQLSTQKVLRAMALHSA